MSNTNQTLNQADKSALHKTNVSCSYTLITKGTVLPEDFIIESKINRDKYVVEIGFKDENKWYSEFQYTILAETIGAIIIGSDLYRDVRYRLRTEEDEKFDLTKTTIGKIINAGR